MAAIAARTARIRIGSAGVMLPHYSPFKVAEQFRVLDALAPGRIDLGVGRAPGSDQRTARAAQSGSARSADALPAAGARAAGLGDAARSCPRAIRAAASRRCRAGATAPQLWMLGSSGYGAQLAAHFGLPYAFAYFITDGEGCASGAGAVPPHASSRACSRSRRRRSASGRWRPTPKTKPGACSPAASARASTARPAASARCCRRSRRCATVQRQPSRPTSRSSCGARPWSGRRAQVAARLRALAGRLAGGRAGGDHLDLGPAGAAPLVRAAGAGVRPAAGLKAESIRRHQGDAHVPHLDRRQPAQARLAGRNQQALAAVEGRGRRAARRPRPTPRCCGSRRRRTPAWTSSATASSRASTSCTASSSRSRASTSSTR